MLRCGLSLGVPNEQGLFSEFLCQVGKAGLDRTIEVPHGCEVLEPGHDVTRFYLRLGAANSRQSVGVVQRHTLRTFQEHEVSKCGLAER